MHNYTESKVVDKANHAKEAEAQETACDQPEKYECEACFRVCIIIWENSRNDIT